MRKLISIITPHKADWKPTLRSAARNTARRGTPRNELSKAALFFSKLRDHSYVLMTSKPN
jgi:hypothetical protein